MKGLLLVSDGIDSPVAGYVMKKQIQVDAIHFVNRINENKIKKIKSLLNKIKIKKLFVVEFEAIQKEIALNCNRKYQCVLCKRFMIRVAEQIAKKNKYTFLITGDNLAQVASQTLDNMAVISLATKMPILRPLLCNDKQETIDLARKIGTYGISIKDSSSCAFVPNNPVTKSKLDYVLNEEERLDVNKLVEEAIKTLRIFDL